MLDPGAQLGREKILRDITQEQWKIVFENILISESCLDPGAHLGRRKILREIMQEKWKIVFENVLISEYTDFT